MNDKPINAPKGWKPLPRGTVLVDFSNVDWPLLRQQKLWLADVAGSGHPAEAEVHELAEGLLSLLDKAMDDAAGYLGEETVFGFKKK